MSSAVAAVMRPIPIPTPNVLRKDPGAQAFMLLRIAFTVAPILFGLDKFAGVLTDDCTNPDKIMLTSVGPRFGGLLVAAWLAGIIVSLLLVGGYGDVALRDFGLLLGALSLSRLASAYADGSGSGAARGKEQELAVAK